MILDTNYSNRLRYKFPGLLDNQGARSTENYAQAGQDIFVLSMLQGKRYGTYVEIGCGTPDLINNTNMLENQFGWKGISVDIVPEYIDNWNKIRYNKAVVADATTADFAQLLLDAGITTTDIDYASVDCEPPATTLRALKNLPWATHRFAVITFEHDTYAHGDAIKLESREFLTSQGYVLVASNISESGTIHDFEDWWVHPDLVDAEIIKQFTDAGPEVKFWGNYLFPN